MNFHNDSRMNTYPNIVIFLRNWSFMFTERAGRVARNSVDDCIAQFKNGSGFGGKTIKLSDNIYIVGDVYGSCDYPDGRRITTHNIESVRKITDPLVIKRVRRRKDDTVLLARTVRGEEYYICLSLSGDAMD